MKKRKWILLLAFCSLSYAVIQAKTKVGKQAPDFVLKNEKGQEIALSSLRGTKVALFFYPKNDSYYCTKQACSLRNGSTQLKENNIVIFGVNYSKPKDNKKFKDKYSLPYSLLSDTNKKVSSLYGTYSWYTLGFFPKRITFLIDEQGIVIAILHDIDVENHAEQIIMTFNKK